MSCHRYYERRKRERTQINRDVPSQTLRRTETGARVECPFAIEEKAPEYAKAVGKNICNHRLDVQEASKHIKKRHVDNCIGCAN